MKCVTRQAEKRVLSLRHPACNFRNCLTSPRPSPLLPKERRGRIIVERKPGVVALLQPRANFRSAFSAFEFASIREIRVKAFFFWRRARKCRALPFAWFVYFAVQSISTPHPPALTAVVCAPHLIRPAATFSPGRRRNLPDRGGEGRIFCVLCVLLRQMNSRGSRIKKGSHHGPKMG